MRFSVRIFISFLVLTTLFIVLREHFSDTLPKALSRAYFDKSVGTDDLGQAFVFQMPADQQIRKIAKNLILERKKEWHRKKKISIPLTIHQIWPFEEPLPDDLARASSLLIMQHPSFSYKFWRPSDFGPLLDETFGDSWKQLSPFIIRDLAAAQILLKEGGIIVDLESECVHPITDILSLGNCIIGFEPPLPKPRYHRRLFLSSSLIASTPGHETIALWAEKMTTRAKYEQGDAVLDPLFVCLESLTSVAASTQQDKKLILLGPTYFSPVAPPNIKDLKHLLDGLQKRSIWKKILQTFHLSPTSPFSAIDDETIFVHMHGGRQSRRCFEDMKIAKGIATEEDSLSERDN
jgi:hypothetical protein